MKKLIYIIIVNFSILAGGGNHVDTARIVDLRSKGGAYVDTLKYLGGGSDSDTTRILKIGDYLQIDNRNEFVIKTVSRHLLVDDFKLVNKFKVLNRILNEKKDDLKFFNDDITIEEVVEEIRADIIPFDVEDF